MTFLDDSNPDAWAAQARSRGSPLTVRPAVAADLAAVQAIYAHHVENGTGSFEEIAPTVAEMVDRWTAIVARDLPYLVAEQGNEIVGFAYAASFRPRSGYRFTVEDSIYVHPDAIGRGIGRRLLPGVVDACERLGYRHVVAVIGDSANAASIGLHARFGFVEAGRLIAVGHKFGRWLDVLFMQRTFDPPPSA
jgi:Sortase and related acyltransferases